MGVCVDLFPGHEGLEEGLRAPEPLIANGVDLAIRKLIGLIQGDGGSSSCPHHTSLWSCRLPDGCHRPPSPGIRAGRGPQGI